MKSGRVSFPNVPTLREQGYDIALDIWSGVFLPARTAEPVVAALSAAIGRAAQAPDMVDAQAKIGNEMMFLSQPAFADMVKQNTERWGGIVTASGFEPEN